MDMKQNEYAELIAVIAASVLLYQVNMLFFLFTVPLCFYAMHRGRQAYILAAAVIASAILVQELVRFGRLDIGQYSSLMLLVTLYVPFSLLIGTGCYLMIDPSIRGLYRFIIGTAAVSAAGLILMGRITGDGASAVYLRELVAEQIELMFTDPVNAEYSGLLEVYGGSQMLVTVALAILERTVLFSVMVQTGISLYAAGRVVERAYGRKYFSLYTFSLPELMIWPFLTAWALVLLSVFVETGSIGIIGWNVGIACSLLYFLQGAAIVASAMKKRRVHIRNFTLVLWFAILLLLPGINVIVLLGMPLLGVSELWIRYRDIRKENSYEDNS